MRGPVECDASADYIRIAAEPLLPKIFRDQRHVGALFFCRQEIPPKNWANSQDIKVVGSQSSAEDLDSVAQSSQGKGKEILGSQPVENRLAVTVKLVARRR